MPELPSQAVSDDDAPAGPDAAPQDRVEDRYARPGADHLPRDAVRQHASRRTGAREAAFFDLDKTVIARSSTLVMGRTFHRGGLLSNTAMLRGAYQQLVYQLVGLDHDKMEQMRTAALELTRGWDATYVRELARETVEEVAAPLVFAEALELIAMHRAAGRDVWIVSSSGDEVVAPFCRHLGVTDWVATMTGVDDEGRYDGTLSFYAYGRAKANAMRQLAEARAYDLDACFAYSDSVTDLPMLSVVGHPVAVNPDRELRAAAQAYGWEVQDFSRRVSLRTRLTNMERAPSSTALAGVVAVLALTVLWRQRR